MPKLLKKISNYGLMGWNSTPDKGMNFSLYANDNKTSSDI